MTRDYAARLATGFTDSRNPGKASRLDFIDAVDNPKNAKPLARRGLRLVNAVCAVTPLAGGLSAT